MSAINNEINLIKGICEELAGATDWNIPDFALGHIEDFQGVSLPYFSMEYDYQSVGDRINGHQVSGVSFTVYYIDSSLNYEQTNDRLEEFCAKLSPYTITNLTTVSEDLTNKNYVRGWVVEFEKIK